MTLRQLGSRMIPSLMGFAMVFGSAHAYSQATASSASDQQGEPLEEVEVTATRVARPGFVAPTPTTELSSEDFQVRAAVDVANVLNELPSVKPTQTAVTGSANSGFNFINLHGMSNTSNNSRTLVLVDGQRFVPSDPQGLVDSNNIPAALIDRIDIVTGGASAAWGSDAVAGVANIILKKEIDGFVGGLQYGESERSDNNEQEFNLAWGSPFADHRGQVMIAGEYSDIYNVATQGSRPWGATNSGFITENGVRIEQPGLELSGATYGGVIVSKSGGVVSGPLSGIQFGPGGVVEPFVYGAKPTSTVMIGGNGIWLAGQEPLAPPVQRYTLFSKGTFELTPSTNVFLEYSFSRTGTNVNPNANFNPNAGDTPIAINVATNAYLKTLPGLAPLRAILAANPAIQSFYVGEVESEFGSVLDDTHTTVNRIATGFDSELGGGWKLNGYVTFGYTDYLLQIKHFENEANFRSSMDSILVNGQIECNPATVASLGAAAGCVAANPFGPGSISAAAAKYILGTASVDDQYRQTAGGLSIQGAPFSTWAGPVSAVAGVEGRDESLTQNSDRESQVVTAAYPAGGWQSGDYKPYSGSYSIWEGFAETVIPLLADMPLAKSMDLNAAFRDAHYSTSGIVSSWKAGLTYRPYADLLFRGTQSRDERAPDLYELYTVGKINYPGITDCPTGETASCAVNNGAAVITNGYGGLKPEIAKTTTFGFTFSPSQVPGLATSLDFYRIVLNNAIGALPAQSIVNACDGYSVAQNTYYCQFITRNSSRIITQVDDAIINSSAALQTNGVEIELSYGSNLASVISNAPGHLNFRALGTYVDHFRSYSGTTTGGTSTVTDTAGDVTSPYGTPKWRANFQEDYQNGRYNFFLQQNFVGRANINNTYTTANTITNNIPSWIIFNMSVQYTMYDQGHGKLSIFGDINNLLDRAPPLNPSVSGSIQFYDNSQFYDTIGRFYKMGLRFSY